MFEQAQAYGGFNSLLLIYRVSYQAENKQACKYPELTRYN
jgi:hypothetical protein